MYTTELQTNAERVINPINTTTLQRLRALEHLYEQGYQDEVVDRTVFKLLERQIHKDEVQLHELGVELAKFEQQFGIPSAQFAAKYQAGEMGDDVDGFEWHVFYKMYLRLRNQLQILKGETELA
jgi:hypothetical protein